MIYFRGTQLLTKLNISISNQYQRKCYFSSASHLTVENLKFMTPHQILNIKPNSNIHQIKEAYRSLSKKYHPDINKNQDAEHLFKAINVAYQTLKDLDNKGGLDQQAKEQQQQDQNQKFYDQSRMTSQELLYLKIFGKTYKEDPMFYYQNKELKEQYDREVQKLNEKINEKFKQNYKQSESKDWRQFEKAFDEENHDYVKFYYKQKQEQELKQERLQQITKHQLYLLVGFGVFFVSIGTYIKFLDYHPIDPNGPSPEQVQQWKDKREKKISDRRQELKEDFLIKQKNMKAIDHIVLPEGDDLLINHTIYPDIKIYSVKNQYFFDEQYINQIKNESKFERKPIQYQQLNSLITISLEAERCLKKIYIKTDTLKKILKEQGYYEPPGVFQRYYGYLYFKIRRKPIDIDNVIKKIKKDKISLYDLFFYYNSPLPIIKDKFYDHRFFIDYQGKFIGSSHFNHRNIPEIILKGNEKHVYMHENKNFDWKEARYEAIWGTFYDYNQAEL